MGYENQDTNLLNIFQLMQGYNLTWAICGGWAIDLFLGKVTRSHKDVDIMIPRCEQLYIQTYLYERGWSLKVAAGGNLTPWKKGIFLQLPLHCIWCHNKDYQPNFVELLLNEMDGEYFHFRRDTSIVVPAEQALLQTKQGIPILAPEIILLYKAKHDREENDHDFRVIVGALAPEKKGWLRDMLVNLYGHHKWVQYLER
jgi:hypothetical protein